MELFVTARFIHVVVGVMCALVESSDLMAYKGNVPNSILQPYTPIAWP